METFWEESEKNKMPDKWFNRTNYDFSIETNRLENANELFLEKKTNLSRSPLLSAIRVGILSFTEYSEQKKKKKIQ